MLVGWRHRGGSVMERCRKTPEVGLEAPRCTGMSRTRRAVWGCLAIALLLLVACAVSLPLGLPRGRAEAVTVIVPDQSGLLVNQTARVDRHSDVVTFFVTSQANHTSTVLFDTKHGLVCYKPGSQNTCLLRKMEASDYANVDAVLNGSGPQGGQFWLAANATQKHTEFLRVLSGSRVDASTLQVPVQELCQGDSVYWTRRADGPAQQRLIYFCIDICFPSNICVSVCFYYLPE
ncbi:BRICHOS domain-containing protein 5-like [Denticeps clupeoides]|uniref:BRICHOS domain-containing protein 5-like n=1 Tax=Denticeps clupeoides TaxID=299321 RepID=UPI0010A53B4B|nr:BRICHOS domain-containing protein 5-like [Denticeps clupeoides]